MDSRKRGQVVILERLGVFRVVPQRQQADRTSGGSVRVVVCNDQQPYKTLQEFIDHAKKDRAVYGSPGVGNGLHLAAEIFSKKAEIKMQHIPYKGSPPALQDVVAGQVSMNSSTRRFAFLSVGVSAEIARSSSDRRTVTCSSTASARAWES